MVPTAELLDRETLTAARSPDNKKARNALARWITALVLPYFRKYFRRCPADDMLQNVMVDVFAKLDLATRDPLKFRDSIYGFAWTEARKNIGEDHRALERVRKASFHGLVEPPRPPGPETTLRRQQRLALAELCLPRMSEIHRQAIEYLRTGRGYRSLARDLAIPEGTASRRMSDARKELQTLMKQARRTKLELQTQSHV